MERIFPICKETVTPYVGRQICAVLHDGTQYFGNIEKIDGDQIYINGFIRKPGEVGTLALKNKQSNKKTKKVKTSAFFPGFGFNSFILPFAALAFLFALPFFFV
ncbi:hypothetical protein [Paenibacillus agricola]|uniref:Uncharacterized protein n=1 Tax=Paenibacillus agricola TaxID=2716264 RepID=A0ABX0J527_9BACL|nr:hypothetical protein [Paenibacillus agricola]NHN30753.1 hypothetical protein [Paenibacillus agricola]